MTSLLFSANIERTAALNQGRWELLPLWSQKTNPLSTSFQNFSQIGVTSNTRKKASRLSNALLSCAVRRTPFPPILPKMNQKSPHPAVPAEAAGSRGSLKLVMAVTRRRAPRAESSRNAGDDVKTCLLEMPVKGKRPMDVKACHYLKTHAVGKRQALGGQTLEPLQKGLVQRTVLS